MNNEKIVNLANLTEHEDAGTKKYVDEKQKQLIYYFICQNIPP